MKIKKQNKILLVMTVFSFALFLISLSVKNSSETKAFKSALLNPKYMETVSEIKIETGREVLILNKNSGGDFWISENNGIKTYADEKKISEFLNSFTNVVNMYEISDSKTEKERFLGNSFCHVTFSDNKNKILSDLFFSVSDKITLKIRVSSFQNDKVYEIQDNFTSFLTVNSSFWTYPEIFFAISESVNVNSFKNGESLLSLRHGKIRNLNEITDIAGIPEKINSFYLEDIDGRTMQFIDIYSFFDGEGENIFYTQKILPPEKDIENQNAAYEISRLTYERLLNFFK